MKLNNSNCDETKNVNFDEIKNQHVDKTQKLKL